MAETPKAISSYKVFLEIEDSLKAGTFKPLVDIKDFPNLGGEPELLETTTLSDAIQTNILGIQSLDTLEFNANYNVDKFKELKQIQTETQTKHRKFQVKFGDNGENGKFQWAGQLTVYPKGGGVNQVVDMTISISASTEITFVPPVGA